MLKRVDHFCSAMLVCKQWSRKNQIGQSHSTLTCVNISLYASAFPQMFLQFIFLQKMEAFNCSRKGPLFTNGHGLFPGSHFKFARYRDGLTVR